jgi:hypothetical protein
MEPAGGIDQFSVSANRVERRDFSGSQVGFNFLAGKGAGGLAFPRDMEFFCHGVGC